MTKKISFFIIFLFSAFTLEAASLSKDTLSHTYQGERITLDNEYRIETMCTKSPYCQSGAAYGPWLFLIKDKLSSIILYDLRSCKMIYELPLQSHNETTSPENHTIMYHCNQSSFGTQRYDDEDPFPVLYVSQRGPADTKRCFVNVLRILPTFNDDSTSIISFAIEEVQKIHLPAMSQENALGNANLTIDPQTGDMYTYSRNNHKGDKNYRQCRITRFSSVDLTQAEVFLEDNDIKESYEIFDIIHPEQHITALNMQGACIHNRKLYISQGHGACGFINLHVVDLNKRTLVSSIDLLGDAFYHEPEACVLYDGHIWLGANGSGLYRFHFK